MRYSGIKAYLETATGLKAPIALIFAEDEVEIESTVLHHHQAGFSQILLFAPPDFDVGAAEEISHRIDYAPLAAGAVSDAVNAIINGVRTGAWLYYCYNAEYLFHPFSETRNVRELLAFHTEERREAMLTYVIDLYAEDLGKFPNGVSRETACLDRMGYYADARRDPENNYAPIDRQLDFFGGLRWRFEEHVPYERRRIDRIGLFRTKPGLKLLPNHTLNDPEMNTYACPWHSNLTAAICSFRAAKALRTNAASRHAIQSFHWHNSQRFEWKSQQLLDLGLIEPGQWF